MDTLLQDLRYAFRSFGRSPGFTAAVVLCLGIGIGINAAAFSVVRGFLFRSLPYQDPATLLVVEGANDAAEITEGPLVWADLDALRGTGAFSAVGALASRNVNLTGGDRPERVQGLAVTPELFPLLGVAPALGRMFAADEAAPAGFEGAVLISDRLWRRSFGADPGVVGREVQVNRRSLTVVGVMPEGFRFPETHDLWLPLGSADAADRTARAYRAVVRLAPGVTPDAARSALAGLSDRLAATYPASHRLWRFSAEPVRQAAIGRDASRGFLLMLTAVTLVLLIACVNVANLLLARGVERESEVGLRGALGASRRRLVRQLLTEALLLAAAGATLGAVLASWVVAVIVRSVPQTEDLPHWVRIDVDGGVLLYVAALAVGTALVFGLAPALRSSRVDLAASFRSAARGGRGRATRVLDALVGVEVAMALMLLLPAGLLVRSFLAIGAADPGFDTDRLLTARLVLSGDRYDAPEARAAFFQAVADRMEAAPGVTAAAWTGAIPADDGGVTLLVERDGQAPDAPGLAVTAVPVTGGYFDALGVAMVAGRPLTDEEARDPASRSAVVGRRLAERLWPAGDGTGAGTGAGDAVGRTLRLADGRELEVVGVAPDLQYEEFGEDTEASRLQLHVPYGFAGWRTMALMARTAGGAEAAAPAVEAALREADAALPLFEVMPMAQRLREVHWGQQLMGKLFALYGAAALLLALAGIYGVMAYGVNRRRAEIGVRMALGASGASVLREVAGRGLRIALAGAAVGAVGALVLARALRGMLYGVRESDPATFALVVLLMVAAATLSAMIPARAAARLQPRDALRAE